MSPESIASIFGLKLPAGNEIQRARILALQEGLAAEPEPAGLVKYNSRGCLLVIGPEPYAFSVVESFPDSLQCHVVATEAARRGAFQSVEVRQQEIAGAGVPVLYSTTAAVTGYLGNFRVTFGEAGQATDAASRLGVEGVFDLVLDLRRDPGLKSELLPPGYYAPGRDQEALNAALAEIPGMIGEFQKAEYIRYDPALCAHGARGITGCSRCLDACPAVAIRSLGEKLEVDPYLCHGMGVCATACPTGAMCYQMPNAAWTLDALRRAIGGFRRSVDIAPLVVFFDQDRAPEIPATGVGDSLLPWQIEEAGAIGMESWLSCIAYGARGVILLSSDSVPASVKAELAHQLQIAQALLVGLGYADDTLQILDVKDLESLRDPGVLPEVGESRAATFAGFADKRAMLRLALDHLVANEPECAEEQKLPAGSPFGCVDVQTDGCTLCFSCVSVCPAGALSDGVDTPRLDFIEENCVQCGMCQSACPEKVLTLRPRFLYAAERRQKKRLLKEDAPFHCICCGKPFGAQRMVEKMQRKLAEHPMFQGEAGLMLRMCEDCRVKTMLKEGSG